MGLREEAEKIIADQDMQMAAWKTELLAEARAKVPAAMAEWTRGMGLAKVPDYTITAASMYCEDDDDAQSAHVQVTFDVDGIEFVADLKLYIGRVKLRVRMVGAERLIISSTADVATALREQKNRER